MAQLSVKIAKVDTKLGLVFGMAIVCKAVGPSGKLEDYYDDGSLDEHDGKIYSDHISETEMCTAVTDFMKSARVATDMHARAEDEVTPVPSGTVVHSFPFTTDIVKSLGIMPPGTEPLMTGWLVALAPYPSMLAKFASGELKELSIGGASYRQKAGA